MSKEDKNKPSWMEEDPFEELVPADIVEEAANYIYLIGFGVYTKPSLVTVERKPKERHVLRTFFSVVKETMGVLKPHVESINEYLGYWELLGLVTMYHKQKLEAGSDGTVDDTWRSKMLEDSVDLVRERRILFEEGHRYLQKGNYRAVLAGVYHEMNSQIKEAEQRTLETSVSDTRGVSWREVGLIRAAADASYLTALIGDMGIRR